MKDIYYGFDFDGNIIDEFYGMYWEACEYFNSMQCNPRVDYFDSIEDKENI